MASGGFSADAGCAQQSFWGSVTPIEPGEIDAAWVEQFPLSTQGRYIVNTHGERFRLCGVNWYGASDVLHVVGGLDVQSLEAICRTVRELGFNVVRLPFSNEMLRRTDVPDRAIDFEKNPGLRGLSPLEVYDEVVRCLGAHSIAVIINNHTTYGEFCGPPSKNSLWFDPGSDFTEEQWISDWLMLARRYSRCPYVVGYDLRNEIRPRWRCWPWWSQSDEEMGSPRGRCNWARAAKAVAQRLLAVVPTALIVVERIVWPQCPLDDYVASPGPLLPELRGHLVLSVHSYSWSGPGRFVPNWSVPRGWRWVLSLLRAVGLVTRKNYGDMEMEGLREQVRKEWASILEEERCPVWVSEFGADLSNAEELRWLQDFVQLLDAADADWAYWPLNVGPKPGCGSDEAYGMLNLKWRAKRAGDPRLKLLESIGLSPPTEPVSPSSNLGSESPSPRKSLARPASAPQLQSLFAAKDPLVGIKHTPDVGALLHLRHLPGALHRSGEEEGNMRRIQTAGAALNQIGDSILVKPLILKKVSSALAVMAMCAIDEDSIDSCGRRLKEEDVSP